MSKEHTERCEATPKPSYPLTLKQAIGRHLPCRLFEPEVTSAVRWCERYLTLCALLMAWSVADTLADRFEQARRSLSDMFPGRRRSGKSYQGFVAALVGRSEALLAKVAAHLRGEVRAMAGQRHWKHLGFVPMGADGSKVECPKTAANEKEFGCAGKRKSTPQQFVTTLLHLPSGVVWEYKTGPARSSEREHLRQMLPTLPAEDTLLIADAGFTGYDLLTAILAAGHALLIRVGANVRLLKKLGFALEERQGTVYLWPDAVKRNEQPPLVLRLITIIDTRRNRRMHLLTSVLDESRLSEAAACEFYTMRWGVELHYRALKQTLAHRKLISEAPATARAELRWAMVGLWLLCLMAATAISARGRDPLRRLSVAKALGLVRRSMRAPCTRSGRCGLGRQLAGALIDDYVRKASKRARDWAHKKKPKPIGEPEARIADESEVKLALELRQRAVAA